MSVHEGARPVVDSSADNVGLAGDYTHLKMKTSGLLFAVSAAASLTFLLARPLTPGGLRLSRRKRIIEEHVDAPFDDDWIPRYNIAPAQPVPIISQHPKEPVGEPTVTLTDMQ